MEPFTIVQRKALVVKGVCSGLKMSAQIASPRGGGCIGRKRRLSWSAADVVGTISTRVGHAVSRTAVAAGAGDRTFRREPSPHSFPPVADPHDGDYRRDHGLVRDARLSARDSGVDGR